VERQQVRVQGSQELRAKGKGKGKAKAKAKVVAQER
jgi:hypothetical protein